MDLAIVLLRVGENDEVRCITSETIPRPSSTDNACRVSFSDDVESKNCRFCWTTWNGASSLQKKRKNNSFECAKEEEENFISNKAPDHCVLSLHGSVLFQNGKCANKCIQYGRVVIAQAIKMGHYGISQCAALLTEMNCAGGNECKITPIAFKEMLPKLANALFEASYLAPADYHVPQAPAAANASGALETLLLRIERFEEKYNRLRRENEQLRRQLDSIAKIDQQQQQQQQLPHKSFPGVAASKYKKSSISEVSTAQEIQLQLARLKKVPPRLPTLDPQHKYQNPRQLSGMLGMLSLALDKKFAATMQSPRDGDHDEWE